MLNLCGWWRIVVPINYDLSQKIKESLQLPVDSRVILTIMENGYSSHPWVEVIYNTNYGIKRKKGKVYSSSKFYYLPFSEIMDRDILQKKFRDSIQLFQR